MLINKNRINPIILRFIFVQSLFKGLCILILLLGMSAEVLAQETLQVVNKKIEKHLNWKKGQEINIKGERAEVNVEAWDKDEVSIVFEFIAKHPEKRIAKKEVNLFKYVAEQQGERIFIRNYISATADGTKPVSSLKAIITIHLPKDCSVNLSNHVGAANVKNLENELNLTSEFCKITLFDLAGKVGIITKFGDLDGEKLDGYVNINARRSNITLSDLRGTYDIKAQYGIIKIFADQNISKLNIDAEKSHVFLFTPKESLFEYALTSEYGNIFVPDNMDFDFTEQTNNLQKAILQSRQDVGTVSVTIRVAFGDIDIKNQKAKLK
ncbi:MAG TPA: hypothetical protein ENK52_00215 [Saprospiraceae bacterium]|nr:hypothetical protein [Saprospiraceae bacterium]